MPDTEKVQKLLSTGEPSTLGVYRKMASALFGMDSKAVAFLDQKIIEQGEGEQVIANEGQMIQLLFQLHTKKDSPHG
jgi:hypothetical protein